MYCCNVFANLLFRKKSYNLHDAQVNAELDVQRDEQVLRNYFVDEKRKIDYVLAYCDKIHEDPDKFQKLSTFVNNLQEHGLQFEVGECLVFKNVTFLNIHGPDRLLTDLASVYNIDLAYMNPNHTPEEPSGLKFMETQLTDPSDSILYHRNPLTISGQRPKELTNAERSAIIHQLLVNVAFGTKPSEYGIENLLKKEIILAAYPLHDGDHKWTEVGALNDRQLLGKFWANYSCWYKAQPLNLIEKYYGPDVAFYFCWLGFYNRMLTLPAILGILCFLTGFLYVRNDPRIDEICHSDILICPNCPLEENCKYQKLKDGCVYTTVSLLFDNVSTLIFAVFMSIWATVFMNLWKRQEGMYKHRWNISSVLANRSVRADYLVYTDTKRVSQATGKLEPHLSVKEKFRRYSISYFCCIFLIIIVLIVLVTVTVFRMKIRSGHLFHSINVRYRGIAASTITAVVHVTVIFILSTVYRTLSLILTRYELHRTVIEHNNSMIYKSFALDLVNTYAGLFYIAFFKGKFYNHPGDPKQYTWFLGISADRCDVPGCIFDLGIFLIIQLGNRIITKNTPLVYDILRHKYTMWRKKIEEGTATTRWEEDYVLNPPTEFPLLINCNDAVVHYGLVICFVAACPLAPFFALVFNIIKLRTDAIQINTVTRRIVARRVNGLEAWNSILRGLTFASILTNACIIAFTSDILSRIYYYTQVSTNLKGYLHNTLSSFNVASFKIRNSADLISSFGGDDNKETICYYVARRHHHNHLRGTPFTLTKEHWRQTAMQFMFVAIFEHVMMVLNGVISYMIPDLPLSIAEKVYYQEQMTRQAKINILNQNIPKKGNFMLKKRHTVL